MSKNGAIFAAVCATMTLLAATYIYRAKSRTSLVTPPAINQREAVTPAQTDVAANKKPEPAEPVRNAPEARPAQASRTSRLFFRYNGVDGNFGRLALISRNLNGTPAFAGGLQCEVVNVAGGRGICLTADRGVITTYSAEIFDAITFEKSATIPLNGSPSRCRVSRDGRLGAFTVFVSGHSYTSVNFSTQTLIVDLNTPAVLADLETFEVDTQGAVFKNADFNFWGVTFTPDGKQFYCTLSTQGKHYLVKGDVAARKATVLRENVECPSLSPGGTKLAYKKRLPSTYRVGWRLHVLDLASGRDTPLAEDRSVDDQLEWLDENRVLYALPSSSSPGASTNVWVATADGSTPPQVFLNDAYSPSVER